MKYIQILKLLWNRKKLSDVKRSRQKLKSEIEETRNAHR